MLLCLQLLVCLLVLVVLAGEWNWGYWLNVKKMRSWRQFDFSFTLSKGRSACLIEDRHIYLFNEDDSVPSDICTTINLLMLNVVCNICIMLKNDMLMLNCSTGVAHDSDFQRAAFFSVSSMTCFNVVLLQNKTHKWPLQRHTHLRNLSRVCHHTVPFAFCFYSMWYYSLYLSQAVWLTEVTGDM